MKRFYISFAVLAAVIIYCIVGSLIVTNNSKSLTNDIDNIIELAKNEDFVKAKAKTNEFLKKWRSTQNMIIPFLNMTRIDEVSEKANGISEFCTKESKDHLLASLKELRFLINDIKDAEGFTIFSFI